MLIAQTADGGYVVGGGTIGCGSGNNCPASSGIQCALVEKVSSTGAVVWARAYNAGPDGSSIRKIRQTGDGGLIAAGTINDANGNPGGLILKLDGQGNVQWERQLGPAGSTQTLLNDVQQTADGGYVATGEIDTPASSTLVVKLSAGGNVEWQRSFNTFDSSGTPTASNVAMSIIQSADGGYVVAGHWSNALLPGECCSGALLLKLGSSGNIQFQNALSGGLYCFFNGFSETCTNLGAVVYSVHQTADGGYVLGGDEALKLTASAPIEPWIAKVDSTGNLLWQHLYYQTNRSTGSAPQRILRRLGRGQRRRVPLARLHRECQQRTRRAVRGKTDSSGVAGSACTDAHPATTLSSINPTLTAAALSLPVSSAVTPVASSPATTVATSMRTQSDC